MGGESAKEDPTSARERKEGDTGEDNSYGQEAFPSWLGKRIVPLLAGRGPSRRLGEDGASDAASSSLSLDGSYPFRGPECMSPHGICESSLSAPNVDARLRVLYVLVVAVGVFFIPTPLAVSVALVAHLGLWFLVGFDTKRLARQFRKLWIFSAVILLSYAFTSLDPARDEWKTLNLFGWHPELNVTGLWDGLAMVFRLITVVLASQIARAGDPRAIAQGLHRLGLPRMASVAIDTVLALFGSTGRTPGEGGRGRGGGEGTGRGRRGEGQPSGGFWPSMKRMMRGDVGPLLGRLERQIDVAATHAANELGDEKPELARNVGIIAGCALTMLGIKVLKLLPSIPFAPGHKGVLMLPLYIAASRLTTTRLGGTVTGLTMGTVAFLMGDGRYGIFEIVKHVAPGVMCDLFLPLLLRSGRRPGALFWSLFGLVLAVARFAMIFVITLALQAPAIAYAFLVPGLTIHSLFGFLSGYVSFHLIRGLDRRHEAAPSEETHA